MSNTDPSVIDLSHYQAEPDWQAVADAGVIGCILKATEGTSYVDPTFAPRRQAAMDAGFLVSSYHYLHHGNAQAEIDHYLATVLPGAGERVIIDFEDDSCDLADLETAVQSLLAAGNNLQIAVYGGAKLKEVVTSANTLLAQNTSLWLSQYTTGKCSWPSTTWKYYSLWQYSNAGKVPGISGNVDINRFNGSDEALIAWLEPVDTPQPAPDPGLETVTLTIASATKIKLVLNAGSNVELTLG